MQIRVEALFGMMLSSGVVSLEDGSLAALHRLAEELSSHRFVRYGVNAQAAHMLGFLGEVRERPIEAMRASHRFLQEITTHEEYAWARSPVEVSATRLDFCRLFIREIAEFCESTRRAREIAFVATWLTFSEGVAPLAEEDVMELFRRE